MESRASQYTSPYCEVLRAKIILLAAEGLSNDVISSRLDTPRQIVSKWRKRFYLARLPGLQDEPRGGRKARFPPPSLVVQVKALACELSHRMGLPLSRFSMADIRQQVIDQGLVAQISGTTIWRWLSKDALCPWRHRSSIFPRDPLFVEKASPILDLYQGVWQGHPLGPQDSVISADEKSSIQARHRKHPSVPPAPGRAALIEHEYHREGAWVYLAAWDVRRARVFGRCVLKNGIDPCNGLIEDVMGQEPYRSAARVFWIIDNGSAHRGHKCVKRLQARWPSIITCPHAHPCQLAQPDRDLLLHRSTEGPDAE